MNICLLEWNISSLGGRQRTMLAFADTLLELGHDVVVVSNWLTERDKFSPNSFLGWDLVKYLTPNHFVFIDGMPRHFKKNELPPEILQADLVIVAYGGFGHVQKFLTCPVIPWVIHPAQTNPGCCKKAWTNSNTILGHLRTSGQWDCPDIRVVIPPHDYTSFRNMALPWTNRRFDVIAVGTLIREKGLTDMAHICKKHGLSCCIVSRTQPHGEDFSARVAGEIRRANPDASLYINIERQMVAELMGMSRVYMSCSVDESCSLAIYETMAAGCHCVVSDVGAAHEQLGAIGSLFNSKIAGEELLLAALQSKDCNTEGVQRSLLFDRSEVKGELQRAVEDAIPD